MANSPSLSATVSSDRAVSLTINNHSGNWWFKIENWGTCTAASGNTVSNIRGYKAGTYNVWAYDDSNCSSQIASTSFTIQNPSLSATVNSDHSVDLTLTNGPPNWYFRIGYGTCTAATGSAFTGIRGYKEGTYAVGAFSKSNCTDFLSDANFIIPAPAPPTATLATTVNTDKSVNLTLTNGPSNWWFRINWWGSCTAATGTNYNDIRGYKAGTHTVRAYSDSNCGTEVAAPASFTIPELALSIAVDSSDRSVDLMLTGGPSNWWFRIGWWGNCTAATGTTVSGIRGYKSGSYIVAVYPAAGCAFGSHITAESFTMPAATLSHTFNSDRSVNLTLTGGPSNWWFRINWWGTCTATTADTVSNIAGYNPGTHYVTAYSDSGCKYHVASSSFTQPAPGDRDRGRDITLASANNDPTGIWSDGTTMWVSDYGDSTVYAYNLATKARDSAKDITTSSNISIENYMTASGDTMWLSDISSGSKLYGHSIANKNADSSKDFTLHTDNGSPESLYADGTTMWVADNSDNKVYAYVLSGGARDSGKDITLHTDNADVTGIWTDSTTMWVADIVDDKLYAYKMSDGSRDSAKDYDLDSANGDPYGIWSDGTTMWVADNGDDKLYAYHAFTVQMSVSDTALTSATLTMGNYTDDWYYKADTGPDNTCQGPVSATSEALTGLTSATEYTYTAYSASGCGSATELVSTTFTTHSPGDRDSSKDFNTLAAAGNNSPDGIWSDGTTIWVQDYDDKKAYAYNMTTKARDSGKDISFSDANNADATAMGSDGTTMWVADGTTTDKLFAYTISGNTRDTSKDITLDTANRNTWALWANSTTIWVGDNTDDYIYAYTISGGARDSGKDIDLQSPNASVGGLWSDGVTMWVSDSADDKLYAYKMSDGSRDSAKDYTLDSENGLALGIWSDGTTMWVADNSDGKLYAYYAIE